jgi:DNA polymerase/3'-5' exonuclease PolX
MNFIKPIYGQRIMDILQHEDKSIAELKKKLKDGQYNLTKSQQISIVYHNDLIEKIPRAEMTRHFKFIQDIVPTAKIAGSYRRGSLYSSDIDIVVRESLPGVIKRLTDAGYIKENISFGNKKFSGIVILEKTHRHIDIIFTTPRSYPFAMLYFTGSKKFNIIMRLKAKRYGWKLNEYGLWDGFVSVGNIKTERDVFKILKTSYISPKDR